MHPHLARLGPVTVSAYGVILALAFLIAVGLARHVTRRSLHGLAPLDGTALVDWAVWAVVGGILGGRGLYVLLNWDLYAAQPREIIALWHGGLIWYGAFAGGVAGTALYLRIHHHPVWRGLDQVIPFVALGHAVGRLGCFANGCCRGIPTAGWFSVQFPDQPVRVVPTQLLESASLLALYAVLRCLQRPAVLRRPGRLLGVYLIGYALIRGTIECWRANQPLVWDGMTLHQLISLALGMAGVALLAGPFPRMRRA